MDTIKKYNWAIALFLFLVLPIGIYFTGNFPLRAFYKEAISLLTIIAFFVMLLQFYLSRVNKTVKENHKMRIVIKWHKVLGYSFVSVLILHPLLVILPQYFESGISFSDAFITLLNQWNTSGILLGIIAWILMLSIGITSYFRAKLGLKYTTWRILHGILSIAFIGTAVFHVIDMGRHINSIMILVIALLSIGAITPLLVTYLFNEKTTVRNEK